VELQPVVVPALAVLLLAIPVLLAGERLVQHLAWLHRLSIPGSMVAGLLVALGGSLFAALGGAMIVFGTRTAAPVWSWLVTVEPLWRERPEVGATFPLLIGFLACVGLSASWDALRPSLGTITRLLLLATLLGVVQNLVGLLAADALGVSPLVGLTCSAITLTGGPASAASFAPELERLGLSGALNLALAAAMVGTLAGGLAGSPLAEWIIRRRQLAAPGSVAQTPAPAGNDATPRGGFIYHTRHLWTHPLATGGAILALIVCLKAGAWLTYLIQQAGLVFAPHLGAMICGVVLRHLHDAAGWRWLQTSTLQALAGLLLGLFLTAAMMSLNLRDLAPIGGEALALLVVQVAVAAAFVVFVTFHFMGRDYDAAVISAGHFGFGLGLTLNAVANMEALTQRHGPSPRAFLAVPIVSAFLIEIPNGLNILFFLQRQA
jgi:ESS family glutamate:Na+ symporter